MQEETNSILYQRTQNSCNRKPIYGLKFLPQQQLGLRRYRKLKTFGLCLFICVCLRRPSLRCGFASRSVREVGGLSSLYDTHGAKAMGLN
jgi:hypothetical protein